MTKKDEVGTCRNLNCSREHGHLGPHRSRVIETTYGVQTVTTTEWRDEDTLWDSDRTTELMPALS